MLDDEIQAVNTEMAGSGGEHQADNGNPIPTEEHRPCFKVFEDWAKLPDGGKMKPGVWFFGIKVGKGDNPPTPFQQFVCSPVKLEAVTFDGQENNFGRLLRIRNTLGRWREWAMPMDMLAGDGVLMRAELMAMGVEIDPASKNLLAQYLQSVPPKRKVHCALQVGWCGDSFVLPDTVIGENADGVIFQSGERGHDEHTVGGTLIGWQTYISAMAIRFSCWCYQPPLPARYSLAVMVKAEGFTLSEILPPARPPD